MTFEELGVNEALCRAVSELGFVAPMPIQEQVIPYLLGHQNDVIGLAQTGTGKTAAYGLPILQKVSVEKPGIQALVISPTRELCLQISDDLRQFSKYIDGLKVLAVYGGSSYDTQIRQLKKGVQVVVATPGRLVDLMERGAADLSAVENVVLDEADEMLSMGFSESIDAILEGVPSERNTLLFSATMSKEIERISKNYLHDAKEIVVGSRNEGAELVNHIYYLVQAKDKYHALKRVVDFYPEVYAIIFCRTRLETQEIADKLIADGYNADSLHGELSQAQRDLVMARFRQHRVQLLVATDVAARGLDIDDLTHVINYGLPDEVEQYTHRSGRTGRAGKTGTSICIIHQREKGKVKAIEKQIGKTFVAGTLPDPQEICKKQLMKVMDDIEKVEVDEEMIAPFMDNIYRKFELMEREDILKKMVSMQFNQFLSYYKNAPEIVQPTGKGDGKEGAKGSKGKGGKRTAEAGYTRLFINLGKLDHLNTRTFMGFVNRLTGKGEHLSIGRIDLMKSFSFFEVPEAQTELALRCLNGQDFDGRTVEVSVADSSAEGESGSNRGARSGKRKAYSAEKPARKAKGATGKRGKKRADDDDFDIDFAPRKTKDGKPEWAKFFEGQVEDQSFWGIFEKKKKGKKK